MIKKWICQQKFQSRDVFYSTCLPSGHLVDGLPLDLHNTHAETIVFRLPRAYMDNFCRKVDVEILLHCEFEKCIIQRLHLIVKFNMVEISEKMIIEKLQFSRSQLVGKPLTKWQFFLKISKNDEKVTIIFLNLIS